MTKAELIEAVATQTGSTKVDTEKMIKATLNVIQETLSEGEKVQIPGFGTFSVKTRSARMGINPRTKEQVAIPESKSVKFAAGSILKKSL